ncbi:MAG: hypothetical protein AVDCRST_MAG54-3679, partial [uncultured Actinomycetospora sp.]
AAAGPHRPRPACSGHARRADRPRRGSRRRTRPGTGPASGDVRCRRSAQRVRPRVRAWAALRRGRRRRPLRRARAPM